MPFWTALRQHWRRRCEARALVRHAVPEALWRRVLAGHPYLASRSEADLAELRRLVSLFLASKEFTGAGGLVVDDEVAVTIAAQACLPVLRMGLAPYSGFVGIVVHPDEVLATREYMDEDGVVHAYDEPLTGEAMAGGPVMLAWADVSEAGVTAEQGYNVVIHEFAHVLDMQDGEANGVPALPDPAARGRWVAVLTTERARLQAQLDAGEPTGLDPYAAEGPEEFFAVCAEAFFVAPDLLWQSHADMYRELALYFQQDPLQAG